MWEENRAFLKRVLLGLSGDVDLTEDTLQEAYLLARRGIEGYRGGDARAWLATIAKNALRSQRRRRHVTAETPLDEALHHAGEPGIGSRDHLAALETRRAISGLTPVHRTALIMKHYGGFTYKDIAARQHCTVGTAKSRVWTAIQRLRVTLGAVGEANEMESGHPSKISTLDYVYGNLPKEEARVVEAHIKACSACREQVDTLGRIVSAMDDMETECKCLDVYDISDDGAAKVYGLMRGRNTSGRPLSEYEFWSMRYNLADYITVQGVRASFDVNPEDEYNKYTVRVPHEVEPGGQYDTLYVFHTTPGGPNAAENLGDGRWRLVPDNSGGEGHYVRALALTLPDGAKLISADPPAEEVRNNGALTLIWRWIIEHGERYERPVIEYER